MNAQEPAGEPINTAPLLAGRLAVALLVWIGSAAVIFAAYGVIEGLWLREFPLETSRLAYLGRDLTAALVGGVAAGLYLFGRVLPSLDSGLETPARPESAAALLREALAGWLLGLRWVAVLVSVAVVAFATSYGPRVESGAAPYLWAGVALLFVFNTVLSVYGTRRIGTQNALVGQVAVDVGILAWLVHHAGGLSNPFAGFFVFHAAIAAVVLDPPWPRRAAVGIALFVLVLGITEVSGWLPPGCVLDGGGGCVAPPADWMLQAATGTAVAVMVVVCGLIVASLVRVLHADRERLAAARAQVVQEERMAVVGKLAAALAHELNNPLGAIALFAQHALDEVRPQHPLHDHLGTVLRNANLCKKIVWDLLEYARQRPPERREVSLAEIVADAERTLMPQAEDCRVTLHREDVTGSGARVYGDPDQLRQVLVNLGLNAIEAMPDGGTLTFRLGRTEEGRLRIDVVDTGVGIPPEEQERIFTAFHTTKSEGTGLGLTVARDILAAHGGVLAVESSEVRGSTFTVVLPAFDAVEASADAVEASPS
ncbi:MAG: hypothetical protein A3F70_09460 [Acidobacteria bacterium RIFCSPLOWO2_12_FULL_67_14]|nr:MAG: hypothetical protein A3H29_14975 [Acidobacteria bacterium RIFCSPLOWO2_02_FULL_67_21]OFW38260.1 MAG: hypothetical protein A3F70_09460 [Acidobacteria bacterium RIFCSPLOWO2_12_FULL_67_14]